MKERRILYIMGIDWEWIYQRPQILAEKLAGQYDVTVVFPRSIVNKNKKNPSVNNIHFKILWTIPFQEKNKLIERISWYFNRSVFCDLNEYQYIYIGYPLYARYIPEDYKGKIIYDCMDNHEALYPDQKRVEKVVRWENELIKKCDLLVVSSQLLKNKANRIAEREKSILVRNGVAVKDIGQIKESKIKTNYSVCYIGTVSEWFDYNLLLDSKEKFPNIAYHLIGPTIQQVNSTNIVYDGIVEHEKLGKAIKDYDCLIMPFCVNEIVKSVDPVKLYEYIAFGKCIISVYYPEIERFKDFVYFYRNKEEYDQILEQMIRQGFPPKYTTEQQKKFLADNTWDKRYELLKKEIAAMEEQNED